MLALLLALVLVPSSSEAPLSPAVLGPAAGMQTGPVVASNGEIALAAWRDTRAGSTAIYAARIDREGRVLDPLGIRVADSVLPEAVVWNGSEFVVVSQTYPGAHVATFVSTDGVVVARRQLNIEPQLQFADASEAGPNVRLLFVRNASFAIVNGAGDVIASASLPEPIEDFVDRHTLGGAGEGEFLLVRTAEHKQTSRLQRIVSTRLSLDGELLGSTGANLVVEPFLALKGNANGYVLVTDSRVTPAVGLYRLDRNGVFQRFEQAGIREQQAHHSMAPRIVRDGDGFLAAWHTATADGHSFLHAAQLNPDGSTRLARQISDWLGRTHGVAVTAFGGQRMLVSSAGRDFWDADVFAHALTPELDAAAPVLLAQSAAAQTAVAAAAGANGFLVSWREQTPDGLFRHFVRRVSASGDDAPRELHVSELETGNPRIVSNGRTYLVVWPTREGLLARRMNAFTGEWRDAAPFVVATGFEDFAAGSNGTDALVAWHEVAFDDVPESRLMARRIRMTGDPLRDEPVLVDRKSESDWDLPNDLTLASAGSDYLLAWSAGLRNCAIVCVSPPEEIRALRLRADATKIDREPMVLEPGRTGQRPVTPAIAWNRGRYIVAWQVGDVIRGAEVTAEGAIVSRGIELSRQRGTPKLIAHGDGFVLFIRNSDPVRWDAVAFDELDAAIGLPRVTIAHAEHATFGSLDAVSNGSRIFTVYDRTGGPETGFVPRVVTRLFELGPPDMRRRAVR